MTTRKTDGQGGLDVQPLPYLRLQPGLPLRRTPPIEAAIGKKMRAMYDDLLRQPLPDRLVELLKQIDRPGETKSQ
jgi:hypothetical protein